MKFSFIVPIYNRREELGELLHSFKNMDFGNLQVEFLVVDDGSTEVLQDLAEDHGVIYLRKENEGPAMARNYGAERASGDYFIFLDSDTLLPQNYLKEVKACILKSKLDAFGGPDRAQKDFTIFQRAVNFSMTSWITTGGLRGNKKFDPRSFNMGISKRVFETLNGFSSMRYGEDIDFSMRIRKGGFKIGYIEKAFVYHKRRGDSKSFFRQVFNFGSARPVLNKKYPEGAKFSFWLPSLFVLGVVLALFTPLYWIYGGYFGLLFIISSAKTKNILVGLVSIWTTLIQFFGYGLGFISSQLKQ
ncbi:glycosyltransferase [Flavobacteriaceae bacterium]|nr:glycosyltransferase [Flavobacteriaceae bacterium]